MTITDLVYTAWVLFEAGVMMSLIALILIFATLIVFGPFLALIYVAIKKRWI